LIRFFGAESLSIVEAGRDDMSAACDHYYAEAFVARGQHGHHDFGTLRFFPERLRDLRKFGPAYEADGLLYPKMVFVGGARPRATGPVAGVGDAQTLGRYPLPLKRRDRVPGRHALGGRCS